MGDEAYDDLLVDLYDQREGVQGREDVPFYRDLARDADGPALELACGTGRVYLELLADGLDVDGLDASGQALDALRADADRRGLDPSVWQADVTEFDVDRAYELVYYPFNSLQHLLDVEEQLAAFERAHDALAPGGQFVFDVFVPSFDRVCEDYGEWTATAATYDGAEHELRSRTRIVDEVTQTVLEEVELRTLDGEVVATSSFRLTFLPPQHVELLARLSPFEGWSAAGGYEGQALEHGTSTQVWTLTKRGQ